MAPHASPGDDLIHNFLSRESGQSAFACSLCRRQKVKCDRLLPACGHCAKASRPCTYPLTVQKPGPKAGTHRRSRLQTFATSGDRAEVVGYNTKKLKIDECVSVSPTPPVGQTLQQPSIDWSRPGQEPSHSSTTVGTNSQSPIATNRSSNPLLRIVHPDHEPSTSHPMEYDRHENGTGNFLSRFSEVCRTLGCSDSEQGWELINAYFSNMTSFSLFHRPSFERKLSTISSTRHLQALLSALFSYALRFKDSVSVMKHTDLSADKMLETSNTCIYQCVEACLDEDPPLHLLQSLYVVTFQKLIRGVRGKTWRMLGDLIRMAYELRLHLVDVNQVKGESDVEHAPDGTSWVDAEERRRMWWCLWEMDVFTATIRRLPNVIDERLNFTFLPSTDEDWYNGVESRSCFLAADATRRWRDVAETGNKSPQTWFVLVNSYMFDAHKMGAFPEVWRQRIGFDAATTSEGDPEQIVPRMRDFLDNCLRCAHMSVPKELQWEDRFLAFKASSSTTSPSSRTLDSARYCIHVMFQLSRLMLCIWGLHQTSLFAMSHDCVQTARSKGTTESLTLDNRLDNGSVSDRGLWDRYMDAANLTAEVIRNSSPQHYQYVNPLIANALWCAAASLVVTKLFGPPGFDSRLAQSNFDLLVATLNKFETFWQIPSVLKHKLRNLEETLNHLKQKPQASPVPPDQVLKTGSPDTTLRSPAPVTATSETHHQQGNLQIQPEASHTTDPYPAFHEQDWASQGFFDFNTIPAFGFGQADLTQSMLFDTNSTNNTFMPTDSIDFNDLFMYPYQ